MAAHKDMELKAFFLFVSDKSISPKLTELADATKAKDVALAYVPKDDFSIEAYKVNLKPEVKNTVLLYRNKRIQSKFVNLKADEKGMAELKTAIAELVK
jgi:hypothetical protein